MSWDGFKTDEEGVLELELWPTYSADNIDDAEVTLEEREYTSTEYGPSGEPVQRTEKRTCVVLRVEGHSSTDVGGDRTNIVRRVERGRIY